MLQPDYRGVAIGGARQGFILRLIALGTNAGVQIGTLTPGVGPGQNRRKLFIVGERIDVVASAGVLGFVGQRAALSQRPVPVPCQHVQFLRAIGGGDHAGVLNSRRQCRTFIVLRRQTITARFGLALPTQNHIGVLTVIDDIRVRRAQHPHPETQAQLVAIEGADEAVVGGDDRTRHTLLPRRQEQRVAVVFDSGRQCCRGLPGGGLDHARIRQDQECCGNTGYSQ
ncbi:hypothetical protein D3C84_544780 [compost metagenome]